MLPTIPKKSLGKLLNFSRLKLYQNPNLFKLTKGTPHTVPTPQIVGPPPPIHQSHPLASFLSSNAFILFQFFPIKESITKWFPNPMVSPFSVLLVQSSQSNHHPSSGPGPHLIIHHQVITFIRGIWSPNTSNLRPCRPCGVAIA